MEFSKRWFRKRLTPKWIAGFILAFVMVGATLLGATASSSIEGLGMWTNWKGDEPSTGLYSGNDGIIMQQNYTTSVLFGADRMPIVADTNGDGKKEVFGYSGNYLKVWGIDGSYNLVLRDEKNMGMTPSMHPSLAKVDTGDYRVISVLDSMIYNWNLNASNAIHIYDAQNLSVPCAQGFSSASIKCTDFYGSDTPACIFMCKKDVSGGYSYITYYPKTHSLSYFNLTHASNAPLTSSFTALDDWDRDGRLEIAYGCAGGVAQMQGVAVVDLDSQVRECVKSFGSDSYITRILKDLAFYNADGIGDSNMFYMYDGSTGERNCDAVIGSIDPTCANTIGWTMIHATGAPSSVTAHGFVVGKGFTSTSVRELCAGASGYGTPVYKCWELATATNTTGNLYSSVYGGGAGSPITAFDADDDGRLDILTNTRIMFIDSRNNVSLKTNTGGKMALADVTGDGKAEVVGQSSGKTYIDYFFLADHFCGDNVQQAEEDCDGSDMGGTSCTDLGFGGGFLYCYDNCTFDTSSCTPLEYCGDNITQLPDEDCDDGDLNGQSCFGLGFDGGILSCDGLCSFNTSLCYDCGDSVRNGYEYCDWPDLDNESCISLGYGSGVLSCFGNCTFDTGMCVPSEYCGNAEIDPGEQCDFPEFGGATCVSRGYKSGTLGCTDLCRFNTSLCVSGGGGGGGWPEEPVLPPPMVIAPLPLEGPTEELLDFGGFFVQMKEVFSTLAKSPGDAGAKASETFSSHPLESFILVGGLGGLLYLAKSKKPKRGKKR